MTMQELFRHVTADLAGRNIGAVSVVVDIDGTPFIYSTDQESVDVNLAHAAAVLGRR